MYIIIENGSNFKRINLFLTKDNILSSVIMGILNSNMTYISIFSSCINSIVCPPFNVSFFANRRLVFSVISKLKLVRKQRYKHIIPRGRELWRTCDKLWGGFPIYSLFLKYVNVLGGSLATPPPPTSFFNTRLRDLERKVIERNVIHGNSTQCSIM